MEPRPARKCRLNRGQPRKSTEVLLELEAIQVNVAVVVIEIWLWFGHVFTYVIAFPKLLRK